MTVYLRKFLPKSIFPQVFRFKEIRIYNRFCNLQNDDVRDSKIIPSLAKMLYSARQLETKYDAKCPERKNLKDHIYLQSIL